jgi:alkylation response protein AidB-like acyl-CoA dehydrogenase
MATTEAGLDPAEFAESARRVVDACAGKDAAGCAALLGEAGLLGVLAPEEAGGLGLPPRFALPVLQAAGAGDLAFPLLETLLLARHLAGPAPEVAAALVAGTARGSIAWAGSGPMVGRAPMGEGAEWLLVRTESGAALLTGAALACRPGPGMDVSVPEYEVEVAGAAASVMLDAAAWAALAEDAALLRCALILGAAEHCLDLAVAHVTNRRQFGRPLASFQAMRHLLARQKLALEGIRGALTRAAAADAAPIARQAAFLAAAALGPQIVEAAIQAHGGMGFTWDIPLHRYLRRIRSLEAQGEAARLREAVAAALIGRN